jgi:COMPASS component SWD2
MGFQGHTEYITSLSMCPINDTFLSSAEDRTVRRWDLVSGKETMKIKLPSTFSAPQVKFDCSGLVFGVQSRHAKGTQQLKLFDARFTGGGPFQDICPSQELFKKSLVENNALLTLESAERLLKADWTSFEFSHEGNNILINTESELMWLLDGFRPDQEPLAILSRRNEFSGRLGSCFSTDDRFIFTGSAENELLKLNGKTGELLATYTGHVSQVGEVACNPQYNMIASGCVNVALWIPITTQSVYVNTNNQ